jgi:hypothetical protein
VRNESRGTFKQIPESLALAGNVASVGNTQDACGKGVETPLANVFSVEGGDGRIRE